MKSIEFRRILVANRGEIASRIVRAIRELDKQALVIYADNDRDLPFVEEADEAFSLGSGDLFSTYLNIERILDIAKEAGADAIHPGYGFLAENADFALACETSGIHFIGPSAEMIALMGHKSKARDLASSLGLPVLEGERGELNTLLEKSPGFSYPLLIKPASGGGGKGMRIVRSAGSFEQEATDASREALSYFGSGELYVERFLEESRHIEVQVIADHYGNRAHLFERECSVQRRYQKIVEEAPSGVITEETRERITSTALTLIQEIGYTNAGTVEFLMDPEQHFYFMEMNTRIQVEHPVTEELTGIDLVKEQIAISQGQALSFTQADLSLKGHAMEVRLYAEDPGNNFLPSSGTLGSFDLPSDPGIRVDSGYTAGNRVEPWYDPMLAKLVVKGKTREDVVRQMISALKKTHISGLSTNRDFLVGLLSSDPFTRNKIHTRLLDLELQSLLSFIDLQRASHDPGTLLAAASFISLNKLEENGRDDESPWHQIGHWRILPGITLQAGQQSHFIKYRPLAGNEGMWFRINGQETRVVQEYREGSYYRLRIGEQILELWGTTDRSELHLDVDGQQFAFRRLDVPDRRYIPLNEKHKDSAQGEICAPLNGRVVEISVQEGERVAAGKALVVIESMKMENKMLADHEALVEQIMVSVGQQVRTNQILLTLASI